MTKIAFKNTSSGVYYAFNTELSALKIVSNFDTNSWNDAEILEELSPAAMRNIYNMELVVKTEYDDDTFTASFNTYDIITTSDETAFQLFGYSNINSFSAEASSDCRFVISFDNRNTWYTYDVDNAAWEVVKNPEQNIYSKGLSTDDLNALTSVEIKDIYKRTQLDFMVGITTDGYFKSLTLNLPGNSKPVLDNVIISSVDVHKEDAIVSANIVDIDGDDVEWEVYINDSTDSLITGKTYGNSFRDSNSFEFKIPLNNLIVGLNKIIIKLSDSKDTNSEVVYINRNNMNPTAFGILNNNMYNLSIVDPDEDNINYRIILNDEVIFDWSGWQPSPISKTYEIPRDKIIYNKINNLVIEYIDDGNQDVIHKLEEGFVGSYYGLLFIDEKNEFYSDSLGEIVKMLIVPNIVASNSSTTHSVYVYNKSNNILDNIVVTAPTINPNIKLELSYSDSPFKSEQQLLIPKMFILDKQQIYIKIKTVNDHFIGDFKLPIKSVGLKNNNE